MSPSPPPASPKPSSSSRSMPSSPNSLTTTASRRPSAHVSRCRTRLVLPAPRKPVMTGAGARRIGSALPHDHEASGEREHLLVEAPGGTAKPPAERRLGDETHPDFVGDQHDRALGQPQGGA